MKIFTERNHPEVVELLRRGGIGVLRTDTLYGIVARADDEGAVEKLYQVRKRDAHKPCIILVADKSQLVDPLEEKVAEFVDHYWPGPISIIINAPSAPEYLTRGGHTLAYRVPADDELIDLLYQTGPLVAPSANLQGEEPARTIEQAKKYFGSAVDFYIDSGEVYDTTPSQLWEYDGMEMQRLR